MRRSRRGTTLMEMMIVIAIILLLTGALTWGLADLYRQAQIDAATLQLGNVAQQIGQLALRRGTPAESAAALGVRLPDDPWGHPTTYTRTGDSFELRMPGPDGRLRTEDDVVVTPRVGP